MDNVTHTLVGALLAEAATSTYRPRTAQFRTVALVSSIVANNLPDMDFVYRRVTGGKLGYLLHHRGHTHTLPGALAIGALTLGLALTFAAMRRTPLSRFERRILWSLCFGGPLVHIVLDYTNNYGVHPFWPLDDAWYYGDSIFIVEPALWAVALPALALISTSFVTRALAAAVFAIGLWIGASTGALSRGQVSTLALLAGSMTLLYRATRVDARAFVGLGAWLAVTLVFVAERRYARAQVHAASALHFPTTRIVDLVTTPRPADPFCWSALVLGTEGDRYVARRATVSTASWRVCNAFDGSTSTAPLDRLAIVTDGVRFERQFTGKLSELRTLAANSCTVRAFLRYARAPFWMSERGSTILGDLRFDRSRALEFTEFPLPKPDDACPRHVPAWKPPRSELLE